MKIAQTVCHSLSLDAAALLELNLIEPQLVLVFVSIEHASSAEFFPALQKFFPQAQIVGCSTAGEISAQGVTQQSSVITAVHFEAVTLRVVTTELSTMQDSELAGSALAKQLAGPELGAVLLFGQGVDINGSALIDGLTSVLGSSMPITGGLAGDDGLFSKTYTLSPHGVSSSSIVAVGLYGERLIFSHGSFGGWKPFGPARKVTKCVDNILYELDGKPALEIYQRYLGDYASDLPGSGLLFPFEMLSDLRESLGQIRTILGINETDGSLILAGDINPDGYLRLMHAHTDDLVDGAEVAAQASIEHLPPVQGARLGLLVSCVGRKLVMGGRIDEEVEAVQDILGAHTLLCGFYSNGEVCPGYKLETSRLHNQTMTITCLAERAE